MESDRKSKGPLSPACAIALAQEVLPAEIEHRLAHERFLAFLRREKLEDDIRKAEREWQQEDRESWRRKFYGAVAGGLAAATVFFSLQTIFGSPTPSTSLTSQNIEIRVDQELLGGTHSRLQLRSADRFEKDIMRP